MNADDSRSTVHPEIESQTLRALVEMRELLVRGEFKAGERIREIPLAARLGVSRTPLRLVLDRLEHEGLLQARPKGGFVARQYTPQDILDVIELRGVLEGTAARLGAERLQSKTEMAGMLECIEAIDRVLAKEPVNVESVAAFIPLNDAFHEQLMVLAKSPILRRSMEQLRALPFSSPNAFAVSPAESADWSGVFRISQWQHRAIADAITNQEGARAEALAREHSRMGRQRVNVALQERSIREMPGGSLVRIPEAV